MMVGLTFGSGVLAQFCRLLSRPSVFPSLCFGSGASLNFLSLMALKSLSKVLSFQAKLSPTGGILCPGPGLSVVCPYMISVRILIIKYQIEKLKRYKLTLRFDFLRLLLSKLIGLKSFLSGDGEGRFLGVQVDGRSLNDPELSRDAMSSVLDHFAEII